VSCIAIDLGIHGDSFNSHLARGADDANRDFASIGDEQLSRIHYTVAFRRSDSSSPNDAWREATVTGKTP
jgi:hypothetical protein